MAEDPHHSPEDFLNRMEAGDFDGELHSEIGKLSKEELSEVAQILMNRDNLDP